MLLFFSFIVLIVIFIILLIYSEIKILIENFEISNLEGKLRKNIDLKVELYILKKIRILRIKINNNKYPKILKNEYIQKKFEKIKAKGLLNEKLDISVIRSLITFLRNGIKIDMLKFRLFIDTENVILTSYIVGIISIILPNVLRKYINEFGKQNYNYKIIPIYNNKNLIFLNLKSIISIKTVHIINMLKNNGRIQINERTSSRRINAYSYGKH